MTKAIEEALELIKARPEYTSMVSEALLRGVVDGNFDIDKASQELFALAETLQLENPPTVDEIRAALTISAEAEPVEYEAPEPLGDFHIGNFSRVNLSCEGAFIARLKLLKSLDDALWTSKWIAVGNSISAYLDGLHMDGLLNDGDSFIVVVEIGAGDDQYGPMLQYNEGIHNPKPRYAANFGVEGTTCKTQLWRDDDTNF